ncbi:MAG: hypothetical protein ACREGK_04260, partial [Geminicoccales bacterium]
VQGLRRIDVSVRGDDDPDGSSIVSLAGFVGATATAAPPSGTDWYGEAGPGDPGEEDEGGQDQEFEDEDTDPEGIE